MAEAELLADLDEDDEPELSLIEHLVSHLVNETLSPEILDPNNELYQAILQNINEQKEKIEQSTNVLEKGVYELELKRIRYMLHSWKRKRLMKLQKHVFYYIPSSENSQNSSQSQSQPPPRAGILTKEEQEFGTKYKKLVSQHLYKMNLNNIPQEYQHIPKELRRPPNLDEYVFVKAMKHLPNIMLNDDGEETLDLKLGSVGVARYEPFRELLQDHAVDLV